MSKRIITLGTWDGKPIEWIVLKEENSHLLLITKTKIGNRRKYSNNNNNSWKRSDIRAFLNGDFFNKAFNSDEQKLIVNAYLSKPECTKDNVFILEWDEAKSLIGNDDEYNSNRQCHNDWCCWWRTPDQNQSSKVMVSYPNACNCNTSANNEFTIRPVIWIRKE